jgi:hypothetical protein
VSFLGLIVESKLTKNISMAQEDTTFEGKQTTTAASARTTGEQAKNPYADEKTSEKDSESIAEAEGENKRVEGDPNQGTETR